MLRVLGLVINSRHRRRNRCRLTVGMCVKHVDHFHCTTHDFTWKSGEFPCQGWAVQR